MDHVTTDTSQKKQVNIISNIVILPREDVQQASDIRNLMSKHGAASEESLLFKHLSFDFSNRKRKNSLDYEHSQKKSRRESNDSNDDDTVVFNYLTGSYETIEPQFKEESPDDCTVPKEECDIIVEEVSFREESFPYTVTIDNDANVGHNWANSVKGFSVLENVSLLGNILSSGDNTKSSINTVPHVSPNLKTKAKNNSILEFLLKGQTSRSSTDIQYDSLKKLESKSSKSKCPTKLNGTFIKPGSINLISKVANNSADVTPTLSPEKIMDANEVTDPLELAPICNPVGSKQSLLFSYLTSNAHSSEEMLSRKSSGLNAKHVNSKRNSSIEPRFQNILKWIKTNSDLHVKFKCTHCQFDCEDETEWKTHQNSHKDDLRSNDITEASDTAGNKLLQVVLLREDLHRLQKLNNNKTLSENSEVNVPIKCFDCDTAFDGTEELRCHASLIHNASAFKCPLHSPKHDYHGCGKCLYESLLRSIQKDDVVESNQESHYKNDAVSNCELNESSSTLPTSNRSILKSILLNLKKDECNTNEEIIIILSDDDTKETDGSKHFDGPSNSVKVTNIGINNNYNDKGTEGPIFKSNNVKANNGLAITTKNIENNDVNSRNHKVKENEQKFHCFDCDLYVIGDLVQFRCHVVQHIGSKFRCMFHTHYKKQDCSKCYYENILSDIEDYAKHCSTCGFVTADAPRLEKHLQRGEGCKMWRERKHVPGELKCFHCQFVTSRKKYLLYHAVDHVHKDFTCKELCSSKEEDDKCLACTYQHCLEQAKRDILDCDECGFRTVNIEVFDVHQCDKINRRKKYRCWDCDDYSTRTIEELKEHSVQHYKSGFRCDHDSSIVDCSKCVYQALVESLENRVQACEKCHFKSLSEEDFNCHKTIDCLVTAEVQLDIRGTEEKFQCFHCEYKTNKKNLLTFHCKQHCDDKPFECDQHRESTQADCPRCLYRSILDSAKKSLLKCGKCKFKTFNSFRLMSHVTRNCDFEPRFPLQCYDCDTNYNAVSSLKEHAIVHSRSRFKCTDHKLPVQTCKKCMYEDIIKNINDYTKAKLIAHEKPSEIEFASTYSCFDCNFSHDRLQFLKEHVKVHQTSQFKCDQHQTFVENCPKCIYVHLLSDGFTKKMCCFDCDSRPEFTQMATLHRHALSQHWDSSFACTRHPVKTVANCGRCLYQNVLKDVLGDKYVTLKCWDCKGKMFQDKLSLERHIEELHQKSKFACVHHPRGKLKSCSECCYEETLLQRSGTARASMRVMAIFHCFDCGYSDEELPIFKYHVQTKHRNSKFKCKKHERSTPDFENCPECFYAVIASDKPDSFLRCYQSHKEGRPFARKYSLRRHILAVHKKSSYLCPNHTNSISVNCPKCWFQRYMQELTAARGHILRCFDCGYRHGRLNSFKMHVYLAHPTSEFKCPQHSDRMDDDCPKCFFTLITMENRKRNTLPDGSVETVFRCYECSTSHALMDMKSLKKHIVDTHRNCVFVCPRHTNNSVNCGKCWFQRFTQSIMMEQRVFFQCLDCSFKTHIFTSFKNHVAMQHLIGDFKCKQHIPEQSPDKCRKCSYSSMLRKITPLYCYECETHPQFLDVQTLKSHVHKDHQKCVFVCPDHLSVRDNCDKCFFQTVVKETLNIICCDCDVGLLPVKDDLKKHIKARHLKSNFSCNFHPLLPEVVSCIKCAYEELVQQCVNEVASEKPVATTTVNEVSKIFKCFDCDYKTPTVRLMKSHVRSKHLDSTFTCTKHSLGEINNSCLQCVYENMVLLLKIE